MTTTTTATAKTTTGRTSLIAERVMEQVHFLIVQKINWNSTSKRIVNAILTSSSNSIVDNWHCVLWLSRDISFTLHNIQYSENYCYNYSNYYNSNRKKKFTLFTTKQRGFVHFHVFATSFMFLKIPCLENHGYNYNNCYNNYREN